MSRENIELLRGAMEAFNARDVEGMIAYMDPNVEYHPVLATVGGPIVYRGYEGLRSWFADFDEVWGDEIRAEPEAYFDLGDETLLFYVLRGRGRRSGVEVTSQFAQLARWRDNLMVYAKVYTERDEVLRDVGVSEEALVPITP